MTRFHAVMIDECGDEFGVTIDAENKSDAWDKLGEDYPESHIAQVESPEDTAKREAHIYNHIRRGGDYDDEGRPIFHYSFDDDDDL